MVLKVTPLDIISFKIFCSFIIHSKLLNEQMKMKSQVTFLAFHWLDTLVGRCCSPRGVAWDSKRPSQCWKSAPYRGIQPVWMAASESRRSVSVREIPASG